MPEKGKTIKVRTTKVQKLPHSHSTTIPKDFCDDLEISKGDMIKWRKDGDTITFEKVDL